MSWLQSVHYKNSVVQIPETLLTGGLAGNEGREYLLQGIVSGCYIASFPTQHQEAF